MPDRSFEVFVAADETFLPGVLVTLTSLARHARGAPLRIKVLDGGLASGSWQECVSCVARVNRAAALVRCEMDMTRLRPLACHGELGHMTYARALIPSFSESDLAIYVDSDFLVTQDISLLPRQAEGDHPLWAAREYDLTLDHDCPWAAASEVRSYPYHNCGLVILNALRWREEQLDLRLFEFLEAESAKCRNADQTALNWMFRGDIGRLPPLCNHLVDCSVAHEIPAAAPGTVNFHYISGRKPWKRPLPILAHWLWWEFARRFLPTETLPHPLRSPRMVFNCTRYFLRRYLRRGFLAERAAFRKWKPFFAG